MLVDRASNASSQRLNDPETTTLPDRSCARSIIAHSTLNPIIVYHKINFDQSIAFAECMPNGIGDEFGDDHSERPALHRRT